MTNSSSPTPSPPNRRRSRGGAQHSQRQRSSSGSPTTSTPPYGDGVATLEWTNNTSSNNRTRTPSPPSPPLLLDEMISSPSISPTSVSAVSHLSPRFGHHHAATAAAAAALAHTGVSVKTTNGKPSKGQRCGRNCSNGDRLPSSSLNDGGSTPIKGSCPRRGSTDKQHNTAVPGSNSKNKNQNHHQHRRVLSSPSVLPTSHHQDGGGGARKCCWYPHHSKSQRIACRLLLLVGGVFLVLFLVNLKSTDMDGRLVSAKRKTGRLKKKASSRGGSIKDMTTKPARRDRGKNDIGSSSVIADSVHEEEVLETKVESKGHDQTTTRSSSNNPRDTRSHKSKNEEIQENDAEEEVTNAVTRNKDDQKPTTTATTAIAKPIVRKPGDALQPHPTHHNHDSSSQQQQQQAQQQLHQQLSYMSHPQTTTNPSQSPLTKPFTKPKHEIKRIAHLGERNSGTRWVHTELKRCFPSKVILPRLLRWKHWFQTPDYAPYGSHRYTLVLLQFRNPYEWVEAMRHVPHHAPDHALLDWKTFVTKPWTLTSSTRPERDSKMVNTTGLCFDKFNYTEVIPCLEGQDSDVEYTTKFDATTGLNRFGYPISDPHDFSAHKPVYELRRDGSGLPYENILQMRSEKIRNFMDTSSWDWVADSIPIQYEMMLQYGTELLIKRVEELTGWERQCKPAGPQQRTRRILDPRLVTYLTENIDWDVEKLIGYEQWMDPTSDDVRVYDESTSSSNDGVHSGGSQKEGDERREGEGTGGTKRSAIVGVGAETNGEEVKRSSVKEEEDVTQSSLNKKDEDDDDHSVARKVKLRRTLQSL